MPKWFSLNELSALDTLTANNPAVLVSFGGTPSKVKDLEQTFNDTLRASDDVEQGSGYDLSHAR